MSTKSLSAAPHFPSHGNRGEANGFVLRMLAKDSEGPVSPIVVGINATGAVYVNGQERVAAGDASLNKLRDYLQKLVEAFGSTDPVIVRPAPETSSGRFVQAAGSQVRQ